LRLLRKRKRPPLGGRHRRLRSTGSLCSGVLASDAIDLEAGETEVSQLTIGEVGKLADGFAIAAVGMDLGQ
jgi:hypothetical protein